MYENRPVSAEIARRVQQALSPVVLDIINDSEKHRGHGGYREGIETHLTLHITAAAFDGKSRVERQRIIYDLLRDLMENPIHALSLDLRPAHP